MKRIRVLLADDLPVVRAGLRSLLETQPDLHVVGEMADGPSALEQAARLSPEVCVIDLFMRGLSGAQAAERFSRRCPNTRMLVLTTYEDQPHLHRALQAGARGYIPKRAVAEELIRAVRVVAGGGVYLHPLNSGPAPLVTAFGLGSRNGVTPSQREREVLRLIALGYSNKEIAVRLRVSVKTVETHKARAMEKLGMHGRVDIVRYAARMGWLEELLAPAGCS